MADEPKKRFKYSIHLATTGVKDLPEFLTDTARTSSIEFPIRQKLGFACKLFGRAAAFAVPGWAATLDEVFEVEGKLRSGSAAAVLIFQAGKRIMACAYGFGHTMLDDEKRENDFGLLVAANSLSDSNVKLVEKANLGSVIRDATQAAGITRLQEFNVDRALSLVRKLSGHSKDGSGALSGSSSIMITSDKGLEELHSLGDALVKLYESKEYQKSSFAIIDKIKPVLDPNLFDSLDQALLNDLNSSHPSFELGVPEIDTQPVGYITIVGIGRSNRYPDISLSLMLQATGPLSITKDMYDYKVATYSIDGTHKIREWSLHKGLVGSLEYKGIRYALNEGKWYSVESALRDSANLAFKQASKGLDPVFLPWPIIVAAGKKKKDETYEVELDYNKRMCAADKDRYLLFDQDFISIPSIPGPGFEICDILDVKEMRLIHVKKSGRRSSVISHFLAQGINSAKLLRTNRHVKDGFFSEVKKRVDSKVYDDLISSFPSSWTVEYKFGDFPNAKGEYTIPFFSRVTLDETKREIEALGFKAVEISFIRLSKSKTQK